jgi:hypothetical protein
LKALKRVNDEDFATNYDFLSRALDVQLKSTQVDRKPAIDKLLVDESNPGDE